jgi:hypothetical protein
VPKRATAAISGATLRTSSAVSKAARMIAPRSTNAGRAPSAAATGPARSGAGCPGRAGKSITNRSLPFASIVSRRTVSVPLFVRNATSVRCGSSTVISTNADASVAWPHSSTSTVGVNHRRLNASPRR